MTGLGKPEGEVESMKPRDRLLAAVAGKEVWPTPVDVMENLIYPRLETGLRRHFGLAEADHEGVLVSLGAHTRWGKPLYVGPPLEQAPFQPPSTFPAKKAFRSIWGSWTGMNTYTDEIPRPLSQVETVADVDAHCWPNPDWFDYGRIGWSLDDADAFLPMAHWARRHADYARIIGGFDPVFSRIMDLCGMEVGLALMAARPDLVHALVAHIGEFHEEYYRRIAEAARGHADFIGFGDDFAGQEGMLVSPARWREYFLPLWRRLFEIAHQNDLNAVLHSCGAIRPVLGDLIDAGLDVFEVVQVTARGMDPAELKREFGAHLTFYGGIDTQHILPHGTPDDVRRQVRRLLDVFSLGGRYILANTHYLMDDVPVENALAMYDEAHTYRPHWASPDFLRTGND
jgi:uroporphyrinogen decarboxylase